MNITKTIRTTTIVNDHSHTYDDNAGGNTSVNDGHSHRYRRSEDGKITIEIADGHTHKPAVENRSMDFKYDKKDLVYKEFKFEVKQVDDEDTEFFRFEGLASTFGNIDRGGDTVERGAFADSLREMMPVILWQHRSQEPLGVPEAIFENDEGLVLKGVMPKSDDFVRGRVIPQMKIKSIKSLSIGFNIIEDEMKKLDDGRTIRIIKKAQLWEVSLVTFPMDPKAVITNQKTVVPFQDLPILKDAEGEPNTARRWSASEAIARVRNHTGSDESPSATYKKAFLFFDKENEDSFTAYKLPIADVIDGRLVAIPRGIFAAAAAVSGARGGVNVSESELRDITRNINRYYGKMDLESPLEKGFSDHIGTFKELKDISEFFKTFGFSTNESTTLISAVKRIARKESSYRKGIGQLNTIGLVVKDLKQLIKENYDVK